jgi:pimeloyl-ACP methyl ester carboxylesterase
LVDELEGAGHRAVAVDLPCEDPAATFSTYADLVIEALSGEPDDLVVVGHSLGGQTIPLVADRRPVARLVYLCALLVAPGRSLADQFADGADMLLPDYLAGLAPADSGGSVWTDFELARYVMYADCDEATARAAYARLRAQAQGGYAEPCPLAAHPQVPSTYVVCEEDHLVNPDWSRRAARERLGVDAVQLPGSHSPFLSRPAELAALLQA